jgi:hypothetical protein
MDSSGEPQWTADKLQAQPVFVFGRMLGENMVTYHPFLKRSATQSCVVLCCVVLCVCVCVCVSRLIRSPAQVPDGQLRAD